MPYRTAPVARPSIAATGSSAHTTFGPGDCSRKRANADTIASKVPGARKVTIEGVLKDFLSVLDDVRSAREHEELSGGFKAVAEEIERVTSKYGLDTFGEAGDPFNPHIHEALLHAHAEGIDGPTCVEILQPGYRIGDRILRPARVAVAEPEPTRAEPVEARPEPQPIDEVPAESAEKLVEATGEPGADKPDTDTDQL